MTRHKFNISTLCKSGVIAALYAALTLLLAPISFGVGGTLQFRISESLTLLPIITPAAVPGLFIGCLVANFLCGAPLPDIIFGSLATLLAALWTRKWRHKPFLAALPPVICNGVIVGIMLSVVYSIPLVWGCFTVALGELAVCYVLGIPLLHTLQKHVHWK